MDTVAGSINRLYKKYCDRNPNFSGSVSLTGHSLGSLILFDLLQNQKEKVTIMDDSDDEDNCELEASNTRKQKPFTRTHSKKINYQMGSAGTGQPFIKYPQLTFKPKKFFAMGSPIGC